MTKIIFKGFSTRSSYVWVLVQKSPVSLFSPAIISFYLNFLFQLRLKKELLVDQDLFFQSKQILNWLKQIIWLVSFSSAIFVEQKSSICLTFGQLLFVTEIRELTFILSLMRLRLLNGNPALARSWGQRNRENVSEWRNLARQMIDHIYCKRKSI